MDSQAHAIEQHILKTQKPSRALGIRVHSFDEDNGNVLALEAPLYLNTNVHQTAFAGSLYSIGVLTSFYLARQWMITQGLLGIKSSYTLVARSATIRYRRPVTSSMIIARSVLPEAHTLIEFQSQLQSTDKAMVHIHGTVMQQSADNQKDENGNPIQVVACEYSVECCAYRPRSC